MKWKTTTLMTPESQNVEWKSSWRDEYLKWICGFANAQGGVLEIGRNDCGQIVGVSDVLRLLEEIPNKAQSLLGIVVDVDLRSEDRREYLQIAVNPHPNPISYRGKFHYRSGSTSQTLRGTSLTRFLLERQGQTWDDGAMPGVRMRDLDGHTLADFRERASASGRLNQNILRASDSEIIERLRLREGRHLKRAAVLLFHPEPQSFFREAYLKIGYFRGPDIIYQDAVEGDLFAQVERTIDLLYSKYSRALISYDGVYRVETHPVPYQAMREAVANAVIHRDYSVPAPIQIRVYDDRVAIWNAGRLPTGWSLEDLTGEHASRPYNPAIADAFFRAGMIESWGRGIHRITQACEEAGNPEPRWRIEPGDGLWVEFPFSAAYLAADARLRQRGDPPESYQKTARKRPENASDCPETTQKSTQTTQKTTRKSTRDRLLDYLRDEPHLTRRVLAERLGLTPDGVKYHVRKLKAAGVLRRVGSDRAGHWEVLEPDFAGLEERDT